MKSYPDRCMFFFLFFVFFFLICFGAFIHFFSPYFLFFLACAFSPRFFGLEKVEQWKTNVDFSHLPSVLGWEEKFESSLFICVYLCITRWFTPLEEHVGHSIRVRVTPVSREQAIRGCTKEARINHIVQRMPWECFSCLFVVMSSSLSGSYFLPGTDTYMNLLSWMFISLDLR